MVSGPALTAGKCCVLAASGVGGSGVPCNSARSAPWSDSGMADAAVLATGALHTSILRDVGGDGDGGKVRNSTSSGMARWLNRGSCSLT